MKKVFVFGTGRCGSRTLDELFKTVPMTHSNHEGVWYNEYGRKLKVGSLRDFNKYVFYNKRKDDSVYKKTYLSQPNSDVERVMDRYFRSRKNLIFSLKNKFNYIDINPYSYLFITYIIKKYPDAMFIHLVRDGREVVRSFHERLSTTYPDNVKEINYSGWQSAKPRPFSNDPFYKPWESFDRFKKICWFWNFVNIEIIKRLSLLPNNKKMTLRLEDLSKDKFSEILNFLNIDNAFDETKISVHNKGRKTDLNWTDDRLDFFWKINEELMKNFGYEK